MCCHCFYLSTMGLIVIRLTQRPHPHPKDWTSPNCNRAYINCPHAMGFISTQCATDSRHVILLVELGCYTCRPQVLVFIIYIPNPPYLCLFLSGEVIVVTPRRSPIRAVLHMFLHLFFHFHY
jgi:hypothetical protein